MKGICFAIIAIFLALATTVQAMDVTLTCDPNIESDLAGYRIYQGSVAGGPYILAGVFPYGPNIEPVMQIVGIANTKTFFVATAYDTEGLESGYSNEVIAEPPIIPNCLYTYTAWAPIDCPETGIQTRTVVSVSPEGCQGEPILTQSCVYVPPVPVFKDIPKTGWSLVSVDSEETVDEPGQAVRAFDGNAATFWHSAWNEGGIGDTPQPHWIQIDLGAVYDLDGLKYLPRQDGSPNGRISQWELYISLNVSQWDTPVASGIWANDATEKVVSFTSIRGRYIQLKSLSEVNGKAWTSCAELSFSGVIVSGNLPLPIVNLRVVK